MEFPTLFSRRYSTDLNADFCRTEFRTISNLREYYNISLNSKYLIIPDKRSFINVKSQRNIHQIKENNQDFEWYPTTDEILEIIHRDINKQNTYNKEEYCGSILDIGAGNGKALNKLTTGNKYAIEKSSVPGN